MLARGPALQLGTHLCGQQLAGSGSRASSGRLISAGANLSSQNQRKRRRSHAADNWGVGPRSPFQHCAGMACRGANKPFLHFAKKKSQNQRHETTWSVIRSGRKIFKIFPSQVAARFNLLFHPSNKSAKITWSVIRSTRVRFVIIKFWSMLLPRRG